MEDDLCEGKGIVILLSRRTDPGIGRGTRVGVEKNSAKRSWDFVLICSTDNDRSATVGYGKRGKARGKGWLHRLVEVALARDDGVGFKQIGLHGRNSRSRKLVMCSTQTHDSKLSS